MEYGICNGQPKTCYEQNEARFDFKIWRCDQQKRNQEICKENQKPWKTKVDAVCDKRACFAEANSSFGERNAMCKKGPRNEKNGCLADARQIRDLHIARCKVFEA